jgi:GPH family glycoside/pentoside/hexuronide:cation symporter
MVPAVTMVAGKPTFATYMAYGVGMTGNQIMRDVPTAMLLFYMTNALFIPPAFAGFAILLPKIWVIFADPMVGILSDKTRTRWGARKPFLFVGSLVSTATFILLFNVPTPASHLLATTLICLLYLLMTTGYSIYSVPYLTLAAEIGDEPRERTTALAYKQYFCLVGVGAGLSLAPWLIALFGGGKAAYGTMALILGMILLATTMATALLVPVRHATVTEPVLRGNLIAQIGGAFEHRPFRIVFIAATLQLLGFGVNQAGGLYFLIYIMHMPMQVMGVSIIAAVAGAALSQPFWVKLANRMGTVPAYQVASLWAAVVALMVLAIPAGAVMPYVLYGFIGGTASCGFTLLSFASLIEAIALDGPDSQRKGLFASAYTAMEKAMLAAGGFIVAMALSAASFVQGAPLASQPASVPVTILVISIGIPVALKLLSAVVLGRYGKPEMTPAPDMAIIAEPAE